MGSNSSRWSALAALGAMASIFSISVQAAGLPSPSHVVVVIEENHAYEQVVGNSAAPYINGSLINGGLLYTNSHALEHPSQPNYLQLFSGSNQGVTNANATASNPYNLPARLAQLQAIPNPSPAIVAAIAQLQFYVDFLGDEANVGGDAFPKPGNFSPEATIPFTTPNLAAALRDVGQTFIEYSDGLAAIPGAVDANGNAVSSVINNPADPYSVGYAHRHDPVANWMSDNPTGNQLPNTTEQDFGNFGAQGFDALPAVSFVVPDTIHDMHDGVAPASTTIGDNWLADNLDAYLEWAKVNNSLLIVTFDENDFGENTNRIMTVMNGDADLFEAGVSDQYVTHYDLLRSLQEIYGVPVGALVGGSAGVPGLAYADGKFTATAPAPVPVPSALVLMMSGLGLASRRLRRRA